MEVNYKPYRARSRYPRRVAYNVPFRGVGGARVREDDEQHHLDQPARRESRNHKGRFQCMQCLCLLPESGGECVKCKEQKS